MGIILVGMVFLFSLFFIVIIYAGLWRIFVKAGHEGWKALIPFYNIIVLLEIVGKPWWWLLLMFIPYVGLVWSIWMLNLLSKRFGKSEAFTVGLVFLPFLFIPILGFGDARYDGEGMYLDGSENILDSDLV